MSPQLTQGWATSAARVTFFSPQAAQIVMQHARTKGVFVGGKRVFVNMDRNAVEPQASNGRSRVLLIRGHSSIVNPASLRAFFERRFRFQTEAVVDYTPPGSFFGNVEWRFGSYCMQAELAHQYLQQELGNLVSFEWGTDTCV
ncbi:hypothetical protein F5B20DRAFT_540358 [Whalleya microplaca]|nr:hypothetical protein F5B20DRAFT_540358 [Whalleya microplaca]